MGERLYTEDTLPAFEQAMRLGADGFETDYWPTADARLVSNHDATLDRTTNGTGTIASRRWAYLRRLTTLSGAGLATVATIERAMARYGGLRQQEIKRGDQFSDRQLALLIELDGRHVDLADVLVTSSELETLRRIHSLNPTIRTGYIARRPGETPSTTQLPTWLDVVLVDLAAADTPYARALHTAGYLLSVRGVDSVNQLHRAVAVGADRIVTDHPETVAATCPEPAGRRPHLHRPAPGITAPRGQFRTRRLASASRPPSRRLPTNGLGPQVIGFE